MPIDSILVDLEAWLRLHAPFAHSTLRPSATPEQIANMGVRLGFPLLPEVETLLRWHNGAEDEEDGFYLTPWYQFLDSERIISEADELRRLAEEHDLDWDTRWVPIGEDGCGSYVLVDHGSKFEERGAVLLWDIESGLAFIDQWNSLQEMLQELLSTMASSTVDDLGRMERRDSDD